MQEEPCTHVAHARACSRPYLSRYSGIQLLTSPKTIPKPFKSYLEQLYNCQNILTVRYLKNYENKTHKLDHPKD
jgi:hypothetical protein